MLENGKSRETITITNIGETRHSGQSNVMKKNTAQRPVVSLKKSNYDRESDLRCIVSVSQGANQMPEIRVEE